MAARLTQHKQRRGLRHEYFRILQVITLFCRNKKLSNQVKKTQQCAQIAKDPFQDRWEPISHLTPGNTQAATWSQNANEAEGNGGRGATDVSGDVELMKEAAQVHCGKMERQ